MKLYTRIGFCSIFVSALLLSTLIGTPPKHATAQDLTLGQQEYNMLVQQLHDPDADVRADAALALGKLDAIDAVEALINLLTDPDKRVRANAAEALGAIQDIRAIQPLQRLLDDPEDTVKDATAIALGNFADPSAIQPLVRILTNSTDQRITTSITTQLQNIGIAVLPALSDAFYTANPEGRKCILTVAERIVDSRVVPLLLQAAHDDDVAIRRQACRRLLQFSPYHSSDPPVFLLNDTDRQVRTTAISLLAGCGAKAIIPHLLKQLANVDPTIAIASAQSLSNYADDPEVEKALLACAASADTRLAAAAIFSLRKSGNASILQPLRTYSNSQDQQVRLSALLVLASKNDSTALNELKKDPESFLSRANLIYSNGVDIRESVLAFLDNTSPTIRLAAMKVLSDFRDTKDTNRFMTMLPTEPDPKVRKELVACIGMSGDARVVPQLLPLLYDIDADVRITVITTLSKLGDKSAAAPMIALLKDENEKVRNAAVIALGNFKDKQAIDPIIAILNDTSLSVRTEAILALAVIGDQRVLPVIIEAAQQHTISSEDMRIARTLLHDPEYVERLFSLLQSRVSMSRDNAAGSISLYHDRAITDRIIGLLKSTRFHVPASAAKALGMIGDPIAVEPLLAQLPTSDAYTQFAISEALLALGDPRAASLLLTQAQDSNLSDELRKAAITDLGTLHDAAISEQLETIANHEPNYSIRWQAIKTLVTMKSPLAKTILLKQKQSENMSDRSLATYWLSQI